MEAGIFEAYDMRYADSTEASCAQTASSGPRQEPESLEPLQASRPPTTPSRPPTTPREPNTP